MTAADLATRFNAATGEVLALANLYDGRANTSELHLFPSSPWGNGAALVLGELTKDELTALYTNHMAKRDQPGRPYYDQIMLLAPLGKCPFCGFGQVSTLDHFLSKARYPSFSVLPINLIPACTDCNKGKGAGVLDGQNQIPHPYFEGSRIETDVWLYASVHETSPATAAFSAIPPDNWPADLARRVVNYVRDLNLTTRFAIEAASELASLSDILSRFETSQLIGEYLSLIAQTERLHRKNSWKAALYEALSGSAWYREGGYRRPAA
ncbi:MAG: hypothetical protein L6Q60_03425 [Rhodocyclaceae bacterium]|nr:hypothetical protein [Rhodocyclaceae bacterium]